MSHAAANAALKQAVGKYAGFPSTPVIIEGIKHEFIRIMHADFGIDLRSHLLDIEIEFDRRGAPWLTIDPDLLNTTVH